MEERFSNLLKKRNQTQLLCVGGFGLIGCFFITKNQEKKKMSENSARKSLKKQGLKMVSKSDANGIRMYAIVDAYTNLIISEIGRASCRERV